MNTINIDRLEREFFITGDEKGCALAIAAKRDDGIDWFGESILNKVRADSHTFDYDLHMATQGHCGGCVRMAQRVIRTSFPNPYITAWEFFRSLNPEQRRSWVNELDDWFFDNIGRLADAAPETPEG